MSGAGVGVGAVVGMKGVGGNVAGSVLLGNGVTVGIRVAVKRGVCVRMGASVMVGGEVRTTIFVTTCCPLFKEKSQPVLNKAIANKANNHDRCLKLLPTTRTSHAAVSGNRLAANSR